MSARKPRGTAGRPARVDRDRRDHTTPRVQVVRTPAQSRTRTPFVAACSAILGGSLLIALVLNTQMARNSYEETDLRQQVGQVAQDSQSLQAQLQAAEASLPAKARKLGMVESDSPRMIRLSDGAVLGDVEPSK